MLESLGDRIVPNAAPVASNVITDFHPNGSAVFLYPSVTDADNDTVVLDSYSAPSHGTIEWMYSNALQYRPDPGYIGTDSFTYTVTDGNGGYSTATMTVNLVNTNPTISNASVSVHGGQGVWVYPTMGDADGDSVSMISTTAPSKGTLTMYGDSIYYTATPGEEGADTITVTVSDGVGGTSTATVTFNVLNDPPAANDDSFSVNEDGYIISGTAAMFINDTMVDTPQQNWTAQLVSDASHGTLWLKSDGSFDYVPDRNYNGTDSFTYRVWDGHDYSNTATVTISIAAIDDAPQSDDTLIQTPANTSVTITPVMDDVDGDTVLAISAGNASHGTVVLNSDGSITYTPSDPYFTGSDVFSYVYTDGNATLTAYVAVLVSETEGSMAAAPELTESEIEDKIDRLDTDVQILYTKYEVVSATLDAVTTAWVNLNPYRNNVAFKKAKLQQLGAEAFQAECERYESAYKSACKAVWDAQGSVAITHTLAYLASQRMVASPNATSSQISRIQSLMSSLPANGYADNNNWYKAN